MKTCTKCGTLKPVEDFYAQKNAPDGRRGDCKACVLRARAARYKADPEFRARLKKNAKRNPTLPRQCERCGQPMVPSRLGLPGLCVLCKNLDGSGIRVSRAVRMEIYERDAWSCQICGREVEKSLHFNHQFAATLDHIAPRSSTLFQDDSPVNLRLAHRACNSARGNRV